MKKLRNILALLMTLAMVMSLFVGCAENNGTTGGAGANPSSSADGTNGGESTTAPSTNFDWDTKDEKLDGITDSVIYVGNTAATTGAYATIGEPFNIGIQAALAVYNANGGYKGKSVVLKTYDDQGDASKSVTLMEQLVYDDEVFAIVGNFGSYAVAANLDIIIEEGVPMVYAAAGNDILYNASAEDGERAVFPVQPLNHTEGQVLILRAFAAVEDGGLGATKVGVLSNNDEASQSMLAGIKEEAEASNLSANIVYQNVTGDDFSAAINAFKNADVDLILVTVTSSYFTNALKAMIAAKCYVPVLTTYNNASATVLNDASSLLADEYADIFGLKDDGTYNIPIYAQAWLDTSSTEYYYKNEESGLYKIYETFGYTTEAGMAGFTEEYWQIAQAIYDYCVAQGRSDGFSMSFNAYALAGYIAGDLFCQGLAALEEGGYALTRNNYIQIMESQTFHIAMGDTISYYNGLRAGVQSFALTCFYNTADYGLAYSSASSTTIFPLTSIDDLRASVAG